MDNCKATDQRWLSILDLPSVTVDKVIDFLPRSGYLVLRQVCKTTNGWITNRSWSNAPAEIEKWKKVTLCITGKAHRVFGNVVRMNLPVTSFYLKNSASKHKIYGSDGVSDFLELYKSCPITLSVDVLFSFQLPIEQQFYSGLEKLEQLKINNLQSCMPVQMQIANGDFADNHDRVKSLFLPPPSNLMHSLRVLFVTEYEYSPVVPAEISDVYILDFITSLKNVELLSPPVKLKKVRGEGFPWFFLGPRKIYCPDWMNALETVIAANDRYSSSPFRVNQIKTLTIDFRAYIKGRASGRTYQNYIQNYVRLVQRAHEHNLLLQFVYSPHLEAMYKHWRDLGGTTHDIRNNFKFLNNVVSLYGVGNILLFGFSRMQKLEEIGIYHDFTCHQWLYHHHHPPMLNWNSLKSIKLTVCIPEVELTDAAKEVWALTFHRLFKNVTRRSVISMHLNISSGSGLEENYKVMDYHQEIFNVPVITEYFTGLRSLTIVGWNAPNSQVQQLLTGLPNLKFLSITKCKRVCDCTFNCLPKGINTLILNLDKMPLLTDVAFDFLSQMPIKDLRISCKKPLPITVSAIKKLQDGVFGSTIENFPFNTWKSKYFNENEKMKLKKGFHWLI